MYWGLLILQVCYVLGFLGSSVVCGDLALPGMGGGAKASLLTLSLWGFLTCFPISYALAKNTDTTKCLHSPVSTTKVDVWRGEAMALHFGWFQYFTCVQRMYTVNFWCMKYRASHNSIFCSHCIRGTHVQIEPTVLLISYVHVCSWWLMWCCNTVRLHMNMAGDCVYSLVPVGPWDRTYTTGTARPSNIQAK